MHRSQQRSSSKSKGDPNRNPATKEFGFSLFIQRVCVCVCVCVDKGEWCGAPDPDPLSGFPACFAAKYFVSLTFLSELSG
jgi:hypothetical protein